MRENSVGDDDDREEGGDSFWQWMALIVLLACWLAEAMMSA
jgi:hypothetical protein